MIFLDLTDDCIGARMEHCFSIMYNKYTTSNKHKMEFFETIDDIVYDIRFNSEP